MKQLLIILAFLSCTAFTGMAATDSGIYKYQVEVDDNVAECYGAMMGNLSNHFNPTARINASGGTDIYFDLLSLEDYDPHPTDYALITITFDNGAEIRFRSTYHLVCDGSMRMRIILKNADLNKLGLLATHNIVKWTMNGRSISVDSPTAGIFAAIFKALDVKDAAGRRPAMCDAEPVVPSSARYHLCMAVKPKDAVDDSKVMLLSADQWKRLGNKEKFDRLGLLIHYDDNMCFLVDYYDKYDLCGYPDWYTALEMFGDRLPSALMGAILSQTTELRAVAAAFGGDNYGNYYWTRTSCGDPEDNEAHVFCPGIPDAPIDRQSKTDPENAGVLLVDTSFFEDIYDCYLADTLL